MWQMLIMKFKQIICDKVVLTSLSILCKSFYRPLLLTSSLTELSKIFHQYHKLLKPHHTSVYEIRSQYMPTLFTSDLTPPVDYWRHHHFLTHLRLALLCQIFLFSIFLPLTCYTYVVIRLSSPWSTGVDKSSSILFLCGSVPLSPPS